jgi:hypothetical protein
MVIWLLCEILLMMDRYNLSVPTIANTTTITTAISVLLESALHDMSSL